MVDAPLPLWPCLADGGLLFLGPSASAGPAMLRCPTDREYKWRAYFAREARCMGNMCQTQYRPCQRYLVSIWEINAGKCGEHKLLCVVKFYGKFPKSCALCTFCRRLLRARDQSLTKHFCNSGYISINQKASSTEWKRAEKTHIYLRKRLKVSYDFPAVKEGIFSARWRGL